MFSHVIYLVEESENIDSNGFYISGELERKEIFANKKSVRSNEFYQASQAGMTIDIMFEVYSLDYEGENKVIFENREYNVIRTYERGEKTELICQLKDDNHE